MEIIDNNSPTFEEIRKKAISLKTVLLGKTKSGKSTFTARLFNKNYNKFLEKFPNEANTAAQFWDILGKLNDDYFNFVVWDTAGQENYRPLTRIFYKDADIIIFFYDSLTKDNFEYLKNYYEEVKLNNNKKPIIGIVRSNYELDNNTYSNFGVVQNICEEEIIEFADKNNIVYGHVSPMTKYGTGINEYLTRIAQKYNKYKI